MISILVGMAFTAPPADARLTALEGRVSAIEARLGMAATAPAPTSTAPTYHYPDNTKGSVVNGQFVTSAEPTSMCYVNAQGQMVCQNLPQQAAPTMQPLPGAAYGCQECVRLSGPPVMQGGCANGQCGPVSSGRRGLFGRRR